MAELIGNVVLLVISVVAFKSLFGKNKSAAEKARAALQSIDDTLESQAKVKYKKENPEQFCTSSDYLTLAALAIHPSSKAAREDLSVSDKKANHLRKKLLRELSEQ